MEGGRERAKVEFNQLRGKVRYIGWSHHSQDAQPAVQDYAKGRGRGQKMETQSLETDSFKEPQLSERPCVLGVFHVDPGVLDSYTTSGSLSNIHYQGRTHFH